MIDKDINSNPETIKTTLLKLIVTDVKRKAEYSLVNQNPRIKNIYLLLNHLANPIRNIVPIAIRTMIIK